MGNRNSKIDEPYFVEVDDLGCSRCGHNRTWTIVGPDGTAVGQSWGDFHEASFIVDLANEAFANGKSNTPKP